MRATLFPWILSDRWWNPTPRCCAARSRMPWAHGPICVGRKTGNTMAAFAQPRNAIGSLPGIRVQRAASCGRPADIARRLAYARAAAVAQTVLDLDAGPCGTCRVSPDSVESKHFTPWVFATARQCAAAGLSKDARECMELAERGNGDCTKARRGFRMWWGGARRRPGRRPGRLRGLHGAAQGAHHRDGAAVNNVYGRAIALAAAGSFSLAPLVTERFGLASAGQAVGIAAKRKGLKVVIEPAG